MLAWVPGMAKSCSTAQPRRSREASSRAVRRSPAAPRRQARVSALGRHRSHQPSPAATATASSPARSGATCVASSPAATPAARTAAARQGRPWVQSARSAARRRRYWAWAEAPGRPTLARTRTATTGPPAAGRRPAGPTTRPLSSSSCAWRRWASRAWRSPWPRGRMETPGGCSSQEGHRSSGSGFGGWGSAMAGLLQVLAGGPLRAASACRRPLVLGLGGVVLAAVNGAGHCRPLLADGGSLAVLGSLGGGAGVLPGGPLDGLPRRRTQRLVGVGDPVGVAVVLDRGRGLSPGPPAPGRLGHRAELLTQVAGLVMLGGQAGGSPLPGQFADDLPVGGAEVGVGLQPAGPALLVLA